MAVTATFEMRDLKYYIFQIMEMEDRIFIRRKSRFLGFCLTVTSGATMNLSPRSVVVSCLDKFVHEISRLDTAQILTS
jgi:hypothetical protein